MPKNKKLLHDTPNQPLKFSTKNWVEINDDTRGKYNTNSLIKLNTKMLKSSLCDYSDACISKRKFKAAITITGDGAIDAAKWENGRSKHVIFKNAATFMDCSKCKCICW